MLKHKNMNSFQMLKKVDLVSILGMERRPRISPELQALSAPATVTPGNHDLIMSPSRKAKKDVTR